MYVSMINHVKTITSVLLFLFRLVSTKHVSVNVIRELYGQDGLKYFHEIEDNCSLYLLKYPFKFPHSPIMINHVKTISFAL